MGSCVPFDDETVFAERVKTLDDDELLEIWVETQQLENMLNAELNMQPGLGPEYEKAIINELRLRSSKLAAGASR